MGENTRALQTYLQAASTADTASAAGAICVNATGDASVHVFGELLKMENIAAIRGTPQYELLRLFAYGTYAQYAVSPSRYPPLSVWHARKLRRLSVITLANRSNTLTYKALRRTLHVDTVRQVEDAVLDAIYAGLLRARLDQRAQVVHVLAATGRDTADANEMHALLSHWALAARGVVDAIDGTMNAMQTATTVAARERASAQCAAIAARTSQDASGGGSGPGARVMRNSRRF